MSTMEIIVGNGKADAHCKGLIIETGAGAPSPYDLFLASLGTCAGLTAVGYCQEKGLSTDGMKILMDVDRDPDSRLASKVKMQLMLPAGFPEGEKAGLVEAAGHCFVKRHLETPPEFEMTIIE